MSDSAPSGGREIIGHFVDNLHGIFRDLNVVSTSSSHDIDTNPSHNPVVARKPLQDIVSMSGLVAGFHFASEWNGRSHVVDAVICELVSAPLQ